MNRAEGEITGLPTLMAVFPTKIAQHVILRALAAGGYAGNDIVVYHRLKGTDQVVYASNGRIAPGQALDEGNITPDSLSNVDTVVLLHPAEAQLEALRGALGALGEVQILFEGKTVVEGRTT